jgi:hypothetical protein
VNMAIIVLSFRSKYVRKSKEINFMYIESKLFKCFECLKSAKYRVVRAIAMAFNATFNNILFISWRLSENHRSATNHQRNKSILLCETLSQTQTKEQTHRQRYVPYKTLQLYIKIISFLKYNYVYFNFIKDIQPLPYHIVLPELLRIIINKSNFTKINKTNNHGSKSCEYGNYCFIFPF